MTRRLLLPALGAAAILACVTVAAAAVGELLQKPTRDVLVAARELRVLDATRNGGALINLAGREYDAVCSPAGRASLVSLSPGRKILVRGTRVSSGAFFAPQELAAAADLAGVHRLLATELADRVRATAHLLDGSVTWDGRPALLLRIGGDRPRVDLVVAANGLQPLGIRFRGASVSGSSALLPPHAETGPLVADRPVGC